jgi:hypothetical protein
VIRLFIPVKTGDTREGEKMHNITINVNHHAYEHMIYLLTSMDDVRIISDELVDDEQSDIRLFEESKKDTSDKKDINDILKEYNIES